VAIFLALAKFGIGQIEGGATPKNSTNEPLCEHSSSQNGETMPLTRRKEQILITMNGVKFLMGDGATEVPCRASRELLEERFGSNGNQDEDEKAFHLNRTAIEQAASDKYDAGQIEPYADPKVVVTAWDMASPLSRKM
jgi:Protein of unknown function (DUF1488)